MNSLKEYLQVNKISLSEFAQKSGISRVTINSYDNCFNCKCNNCNTNECSCKTISKKNFNKLNFIFDVKDIQHIDLSKIKKETVINNLDIYYSNFIDNDINTDNELLHIMNTNFDQLIKKDEASAKYILELVKKLNK